MNVIILCGGVGKRLWPIGRQKKPKQFHALVSEHTLLQETYERVRAGFSANNIFIATTKKFVKEIKKELPTVSQKQFIIEPESKDTAAGMGYAALWLSKTAPNEPCVFVPSDHWIDSTENFIKALRVGARLVADTGSMVDIAVPPSAPLTSLGYTRIGKKIKTINGIDVFEFKGHKEKPNQAVATRYMKSSAYLWHANYYMWTPAKFLQALTLHAPNLVELLGTPATFSRVKPISFDYAVTEKMDPRNVLILKAPFGWSDVGSWDEVWKIHHKKTAEGNVVQGDVLLLESHNNLVMGDHKKLIALAGVKDMIIIDTGDTLLICPKTHSQKVKALVDELPKTGRNHYA